MLLGFETKVPQRPNLGRLALFDFCKIRGGTGEMFKSKLFKMTYRCSRWKF